MSAIALSGIDRPGLEQALGLYGLVTAGRPSAALVAAGLAAPMRPALVQAPDLAAAVALLASEADDVVLASDPDQLVAARLAALVRRAGPNRLSIGDLVVDTAERRASHAGRPLDLLPREYALLHHLARRPGLLVSRAELTREVLGLGFDPGTNIVAVHVSRLRAKLHAGGAAPMLLTERGRGYRLAAPIAEGSAAD